MKLSILPLLVFMGILLSSCGDLLDNIGNKPENLDLNEDFQKVEVADEFSILVPKYMSQDSSIHPDAILSYQNNFRNAVTLVFAEYRSVVEEVVNESPTYSDSLSLAGNYLNLKGMMMSENLEFAELGDPVYLNINGNPAAQVWLEGRVEGLDLTYFLTAIEGKSKVYFILSFTSIEKKSKFEDTFQKIGGSFMLKSPVVD
ncbi:MAG: hypothetical protein GC180_01595 [Bacteroidetes bacterium]|nr:hypothetical protein [Bacteroidota bacterium]